MSDIEAIKKKIAEGVDAALAKGYILVTGSFGDSECACPLGCLLLNNGFEISKEFSINADRAAYVLGVDSEWILDFYHGFDGLPSLGNKVAHDLGCEFNVEYKPMDYGEVIDLVEN